MINRQSRNVSLTPELEGFINQCLASGNFANASEVVREALRLLQREDEAVQARKIVKLRRAIQAGIDSPDADGFDMKKVVKRLRTRKA